MVFWAISILGTVAVIGLMLRPLFRVRATDAAEPADLSVYRDQLKEVARDKALGTLSEAEAENLKIEISRRMLAADAAGMPTARRGLA
ncbi:MAG: c-type cytochrome biogenesis protein CcmI, partial [Pseudomonadota bacterium]